MAPLRMNHLWIPTCFFCDWIAAPPVSRPAVQEERTVGDIFLVFRGAQCFCVRPGFFGSLAGSMFTLPAEPNGIFVNETDSLPRRRQALLVSMRCFVEISCLFCGSVYEFTKPKGNSFHFLCEWPPGDSDCRSSVRNGNGGGGVSDDS